MLLRLASQGMNDAQYCTQPCQDEARVMCEYGPTCTGLLLVHIDHALLLMLVAEGTFLLALPIESRPRVAAVLCTPPMLDIHHALLQAPDSCSQYLGHRARL